MLNDPKKPLCIFMIGIPYSGKSTFIANNEWLSSMPIVSVDDEVMRLSGDDYTQWAVVIEEAALAADLKIEKLIERKASFVIDKTNLAALERQKQDKRHIHHRYQPVHVTIHPPHGARKRRSLLRHEHGPKNGTGGTGIQSRRKLWLFAICRHLQPCGYHRLLQHET